MSTETPKDDHVTVSLRVPRQFAQCFEYIANLYAIYQVEEAQQHPSGVVVFVAAVHEGTNEKPFVASVGAGCTCPGCLCRMNGYVAGLASAETSRTFAAHPPLKEKLEALFDGGVMLGMTPTAPEQVDQAKRAANSCRTGKGYWQ